MNQYSHTSSSSSHVSYVAGLAMIGEEDSVQTFPPVGFRFRPTDEELVVYYLMRKIRNLELPFNIIREINLYDFATPQKLTEKYPLVREGEREWYFFTPITKKSLNGKRASRTTPGGYWKATAGDAPIRSRGLIVGQKKTLCFYQGIKPAKKTNWIMHEFRIHEQGRTTRGSDSTTLNQWVLCKVYERNVGGITTTQRATAEQVPNHANEPQQQQSEEPLSAILPAVITHSPNEPQQQIIVQQNQDYELQQPIIMQPSQDVMAPVVHLETIVPNNENQLLQHNDLDLSCPYFDADRFSKDMEERDRFLNAMEDFDLLLNFDFNSIGSDP